VALWPQLNLKLETLGVSKESITHVEAAIGNHAKVIRQEQVTIPLGGATLATVERSQPAASGSSAVQNEYWLVVWRPHPQRADIGLAYAIHGIFTGLPVEARGAVLVLASRWRMAE
jgi:hypothetical protein